MQLSSNHHGFILINHPAKWIIAMIASDNSCFEYLKDLLQAMKIFFYPSNSGLFQKNLVKFIMNLAKYFLERVQM